MRVPSSLRLISAGLLTTKSKILGCDVAGRVEAVGRNVEQFQPGDEVIILSLEQLSREEAGRIEHRVVHVDEQNHPLRVDVKKAAALK